MHIRYQNSILILLVMGYILLGNNSLFSMQTDDFKEEASSHIPLKKKPYTYEELVSIFTPVLHGEVEKEFQVYLSIIFREDFPIPVHPNETIVRGWQCLYGKCVSSQTIQDEEEKKSFQLTSLHQLLGFHKNAIAKLDPALAEKIPEFGCPSCVQSARKALEAEHAGY